MFIRQYVIAQNALTRTGQALQAKIKDECGDALGETVAAGTMLIVAGAIYSERETFTTFISENLQIGGEG